VTCISCRRSEHSINIGADIGRRDPPDIKDMIAESLFLAGGFRLLFLDLDGGLFLSADLLSLGKGFIVDFHVVKVLVKPH
jgi:hypothetical protein